MITEIQDLKKLWEVFLMENFFILDIKGDFVWVELKSEAEESVEGLLFSVLHEGRESI